MIQSAGAVPENVVELYIVGVGVVVETFRFDPSVSQSGCVKIFVVAPAERGTPVTKLANESFPDAVITSSPSEFSIDCGSCPAAGKLSINTLAVNPLPPVPR